MRNGLVSGCTGEWEEMKDGGTILGSMTTTYNTRRRLDDEKICMHDDVPKIDKTRWIPKA